MRHNHQDTSETQGGQLRKLVAGTKSGTPNVRGDEEGGGERDGGPCPREVLEVYQVAEDPQYGEVAAFEVSATVEASSRKRKEGGTRTEEDHRRHETRREGR